MSYSTPPRGSGRHWRRDEDDDRRYGNQPTRWSYQADPPGVSEYHPDETAAEQGYRHEQDMPTDPTMPAPLNQAPRRDVGQDMRRIRIVQAHRAHEAARYQDMIVPRIYLEPDEQMDDLRRKAVRWGIARDVVVLALGVFLLIQWVILPLVHFFTR
jgi:hypothetical protein